MTKPNEKFLNDIRNIINTARTQAVRSVDFCRVQMYWHMGKRIFEEEQQGKERADYGTYLIKNLAKQLEPEYGSGFSYRQLAFCRQFYRLYPIVNALRSQLNWTQYRMLIQIDDPDSACITNWSLSITVGRQEKQNGKLTRNSTNACY